MTTALDRLHPALVHHLVNTLGWRELRPLQQEAIEPVLAGKDAVLLAPTAGGKTEAATFPLLSAMEQHNWQGLSVLYICPLRALLNNLQPRLASYAAWLGRRVELWHGDVGTGPRGGILREPPDILLTTPESLESMLVSSKVDARQLFANLRTVVVDEVHAFAGDDRGWHLLAVLERLARLAGGPLQRIGLSATVGNPDELIQWLQGSRLERARQVVAPAAGTAAAEVDVNVDYVGTIANAAKVISLLHQGEKRLVFVDSRRRAEELGAALRARDVTTFISHSSLSSDERRRSEQAFADVRNCVIVATSTLELGIDVGDLDRVIQIDAPRTVASFLQRLGRTGRRLDSTRNCLFLCLEPDAVLMAAGLLERWAAGWVEPVVPPVAPRHIAAQQILALALQEHAIGTKTWREWWGDLPLFDDDAEALMEHLLNEGYLERDGAMAFIGPEAERRFGRRYFSDLLAVFSAPPEFTVLTGRTEIGRVGDDVLIADQGGTRALLLAGRAWQVSHIDWKRRRCYVEPTDLPGQAKWGGSGGGSSYDLTRAQRTVLLGAEPTGVTFTQRAQAALDELRGAHSQHVTADGSVFFRAAGNLHWWTWAGTAANRTLHATLPNLVDARQRIGDRSLRLHPDATATDVKRALSQVGDLSLPSTNESAIHGLKFSAALPSDLANLTIAKRLSDPAGAVTVLAEPLRFHFDAV